MRRGFAVIALIALGLLGVFAWGISSCGGIVAGSDAGADGAFCLYNTNKYGWVQCPVDGKTMCLLDEYCRECYCMPELKVQCREIRNDCRRNDGQPCCFLDSAAP